MLICPQNDPESLTIIRLAKAFKIPTTISNQPHGARLEKEPQLLEKIKKFNPQPTEIVIVEIPGPEIETELVSAGFKLKIIDHHRYPDLDRMKEISSLEQFLNHYQISTDDLLDHNFNPLLIQGVADIDQGFIWRLYGKKYSQTEIDQIIKYYKELLLELEGDRRLEAEALAKEVFAKKETWQEFLVFRNPRADLGLRDPLSFLIAEELKFRHPSIVIDKNGIYVQETEKATLLHEKLSGFTYGGDLCWGQRGDGEELFTQVKKILNEK